MADYKSANEQWPRDTVAIAQHVEAITPSDTVDLPTYARGIYVGVGGDVEIDTRSETALVFKNAVTGSILPVHTKRVRAALTTATNLLALY